MSCVVEGKHSDNILYLIFIYYINIYRYLPNNTECPGRNYSWATMRDDNEYLQCSGQKRLCRANSTYGIFNFSFVFVFFTRYTI